MPGMNNKSSKTPKLLKQEILLKTRVEGPLGVEQDCSARKGRIERWAREGEIEIDSERQIESASYRRNNVQETSPQVHDVCDVASPCCTTVDGWGNLQQHKLSASVSTTLLVLLHPMFTKCSGLAS